MKENRPGFITTSGIFTGILTLLVVLVVGLVRGGILYSPGQLNAKPGLVLSGVTAHAGLGNQCSACHVAFWQNETMADRCMKCHTDVAAQQKDPASLHGILYKDDPGASCRTCHPDHRGASAPLTNMQKIQFPHENTGYSLAAHPKLSSGAPFTCQNCHTNGYSKFDQPTCVICHLQIKAAFMQPHLQTYGANCLACHDGIDTYGHTFSHQKVAFQLTGKHAQVTCDKCHQNAHTLADLKSTSTACSTCHGKDNPHSAQLGTDCASCHTTGGWTPATIEHNLTAFPLTGKHIQVDCSACHINDVYQGTPTTCYACHKVDDKHNGAFGTDCSQCHQTSGWLPALFDHSGFPLTNGHAGLACSSCHASGVYKGLSTFCATCHKAPASHVGLFNSNCASCHSTSNWNFNHPNNCGEGSCLNHHGATCQDCHANGYTSHTCTKCHSSNNPGD